MDIWEQYCNGYLAAIFAMDIGLIYCNGYPSISTTQLNDRAVAIASGAGSSPVVVIFIIHNLINFTSPEKKK